MQKRLFRVMAGVVCLLLLFSLPAFTQGPQRDAQGRLVYRNDPPPAPLDNRPFDPKDLSGYFLRTQIRPRESPPLTEAGKKAMEGRVTDEMSKYPTEQNDPMYKCNPQGFPRLVWEENEPIEFVMLPNRILQLFQWERTLRELWMDGRALPSGENLENLGPNWYGHSVARWEGNTLVVETTGVDPRAWLDEWGRPKSLTAKYEERYTRISHDVIEGQLTINDPVNFTAPWVHPKSQFRRMAEHDVTFFGWRGLFSGIADAICAPVNEIDEYDKKIRDPAVLGK